jgi:hypothetical protein
MISQFAFTALALLGALPYAQGQSEGGGGAPPVIVSPSGTTTAGPSEMTALSTLKLAKMYTASSFQSEWGEFAFSLHCHLLTGSGLVDWFTDDDPTAGYVKYVQTLWGMGRTTILIISLAMFPSRMLLPLELHRRWKMGLSTWVRIRQNRRPGGAGTVLG